MDRAEGIGLAVAIAAHIALFIFLSIGLVTREIPKRQPVAVTLTDDIGEIATAADRPAPAAPQQVEQQFSPLPPPPPPPVPSAAPRPAPTPTPVRPTPAPRPTPPQRAERRPEPARQPERPAPQRDERPRRRPDSRLSGITEGITSPANDTGSSSSQATVSSSDRSNLISRITNAIRPCYNLGSLGGTSAEDIVVRLRIQPSRNGSVSSGQITFLGANGVNGSNREYQRQMIEAARSAVLNPRCPFPNLPDSMYDEGWSDVVLNFVPAQLT